MGPQKEPNKASRAGAERWFCVQGVLSELNTLEYIASHTSVTFHMSWIPYNFELHFSLYTFLLLPA